MDYQDVGANAYDGDKGQERADENIKKFVEGHIVDAKEWKEGDEAKTLDGAEVWLEKKGDGLTVSDDSTDQTGCILMKVDTTFWFQSS